ncbi:MAG TPA: ATP-binding protein [Chloroflexota bacterium]|nr:ATP-binding protein [Chloroflexota bacterium]
MPAERENRFAAAARAGRELLLFGGVVADEPGQLMLALAEALGRGDGCAAGERYRRLFAALAEEVELGRSPPGDAWQAHLVERLLADENPFSRKCEMAGADAPGPETVSAARCDLAALRRLHELDAASVRAALGGELPSWAGFRSLSAPWHAAAETALRARLAAEADWAGLVPALAHYYAESGAGVLARQRAFRWVGGGRPIEVVQAPDPVRLSDLIGYDMERELVVRNTAHFVAGHAANNVLIYGDRGTGKSSTVKALLNEYAPQGLRLIEVPKGRLGDLIRILALLRGRRERFVLFVDDLSFDDHETHYKDLKAVLEGGLESRPANVLLYATSNRRHLVQERFSDRRGPTDEVHVGDTAQEKLSFSDRFGISVTFAQPDQERYLQIVGGLAAARGLRVEPAELRRRALEWAAWQNGRSGRTARQFVDFLAGELGMPPAEPG